MAFCVSCGNSLTDGTAFCPKCGARTGSSTQGPGPASATPTVQPNPVAQPAPSLQPAAGAPASNAGCGKALLIVGIVVLLCAVFGIAGVVYVGYRAKKKVDEIKQNITREVGAAPEKQPGRASPSAPPDKGNPADGGGPKGTGLLDQLLGDHPLPMYVDDVPRASWLETARQHLVPAIPARCRLQDRRTGSIPPRFR